MTIRFINLDSGCYKKDYIQTDGDQLTGVCFSQCTHESGEQQIYSEVKMKYLNL